MDPSSVIGLVRSVLTPDLLKPGFGGGHPMSGHCYVASEACYHLLGGTSSGLTPCCGRDDEGVPHWWLVDHTGNVIDATADQYYDRGVSPPYSSGRRLGFLTREPSRRARVVLDRIGR